MRIVLSFLTDFSLFFCSSLCCFSPFCLPWNSHMNIWRKKRVQIRRREKNCHSLHETTECVRGFQLQYITFAIHCLVEGNFTLPVSRFRRSQNTNQNTDAYYEYHHHHHQNTNLWSCLGKCRPYFGKRWDEYADIVLFGQLHFYSNFILT